MMMRLQAKAQATGPAQEKEALSKQLNKSQHKKAAHAVKRPAQPRPRPVQRQLPKIGRNETVVIGRGKETMEVKFKKAEQMILNEGWRLLPKLLLKNKSIR